MADQDDRFMNAASLEEMIEHGFAELVRKCQCHKWLVKGVESKEMV